MEKKVYEAMPLWRWLAHEMGHAVENIKGGYLRPDLENLNIRRNENPIAIELNAPRRGDWQLYITGRP